MPIGTCHVLEGIYNRFEDNHILQVKGDGIWILDLDEPTPDHLIGACVKITGIRIDFSHLAVKSIEPAAKGRFPSIARFSALLRGLRFRFSSPMSD